MGGSTAPLPTFSGVVHTYYAHTILLFIPMVTQGEGPRSQTVQVRKAKICSQNKPVTEKPEVQGCNQAARQGGVATRDR